MRTGDLRARARSVDRPATRVGRSRRHRPEVESPPRRAGGGHERSVAPDAGGRAVDRRRRALPVGRAARAAAHHRRAVRPAGARPPDAPPGDERGDPRPLPRRVPAGAGRPPLLPLDRAALVHLDPRVRGQLRDPRPRPRPVDRRPSRGPVRCCRSGVGGPLPVAPGRGGRAQVGRLRRVADPRRAPRAVPALGVHLGGAGRRVRHMGCAGAAVGRAAAPEPLDVGAPHRPGRERRLRAAPGARGGGHEGSPPQPARGSGLVRRSAAGAGRTGRRGCRFRQRRGVGTRRGGIRAARCGPPRT